ncbi:uncharacterized protein LOC132933560 [Metopolophium dirhodum]|uniref:uncharacterized protein LOC132933560 n=1 Tax=Metopolophium dirhodum TaxID=44670 RepID=UPI0029903EE4|nr:uncharacterized protein LOC132933560 [Metopolophium dirhodum]
MHKTYIVCDNTSNNTKVYRPGVIYYGIPKNEYMKRKWLKVLEIDRCHDFKSTRWLSKLTGNNEDMSNKNMQIAEKTIRVLKQRRTMAAIKRNHQLRLALKSSGISNIMKP